MAFDRFSGRTPWNLDASLSLDLEQRGDMSDDLANDGTVLIGDTEAGTVFYWLTLVEEPGSTIAEGCISGSEEFMQRIASAEQVKLRLDDGPTFSLVTDGGAGGSRWVRLFKL
jgi:outer membrane protein assembly factor BamB